MRSTKCLEKTQLSLRVKGVFWRIVRNYITEAKFMKIYLTIQHILIDHRKQTLCFIKMSL